MNAFSAPNARPDLLHTLTLFFSPSAEPALAPSPAKPADLVAEIKSEPALRMWVLALAGKSHRVQTALLARAAQVLRDLPSQEATLALLARLEDRETLAEVLAALRTESR